MGAKWSKQENEYLIKYYFSEPIDAICKFVNRSKDSVVHQARKLGLYKREKKLVDEEMLCWSCKYATNKIIGKCSWAGRFKPVEGWEIKEKTDLYGFVINGEYRNAFVVVKCPIYKKE